MPRLGRPASSNADETRERIIVAARRLFAERGWEGASNRALADSVGLTTGALYHYFDRKLDLWAAVHDETYRVVLDRMRAPLDEPSTFIDTLRAVLEIAHELNNHDPSLAQFLAASAVDAQRHPELKAVLVERGDDRRQAFFADLVDLAVRNGEVDHAHASALVTLLQTVTVGLVNAVSRDADRHRTAVDAIVELFEGKLIRPPA